MHQSYLLQGRAELNRFESRQSLASDCRMSQAGYLRHSTFYKQLSAQGTVLKVRYLAYDDARVTRDPYYPPNDKGTLSFKELSRRKQVYIQAKLPFFFF